MSAATLSITKWKGKEIDNDKDDDKARGREFYKEIKASFVVDFGEGESK
jgi:hypothetical protein